MSTSTSSSAVTAKEEATQTQTASASTAPSSTPPASSLVTPATQSSLFSMTPPISLSSSWQPMPSKSSSQSHFVTSSISTCKSKHQRLKIGFINARSARNKTEEICDLIVDNKIDVLFITETWLSSAGEEVISAELTPPNYNILSYPRNGRKGGGIAIIYRKSLQSKIKSQKFYTKTFESAITSFDFGHVLIPFVCIYRPPNRKFTAKQFFEEFQDIVDKTMTFSKKPVFLGDFNLHFDNTRDKNVENFCSILGSYGLEQKVRSPTHEKGHILDWLLTNEETEIFDLEIIDKCVSDHFLIHFEMSTRKPTPIKRVVVSRGEIVNEERFFDGLKEMSEAVMSSEDKVTEYNTRMKQLLDQHAPLVQRTVTERPSAPWMNLEIKVAKTDRRRAERKWRSTQLQIDKELYRQQNKKVKILIKKSRTEYYNNKIEECTNSKALFGITKTLTGKDTQHNDRKFPTSYLKSELPHVFGHFFKTKVETIRNNMDQDQHTPPTFKPFHGDQTLSNFKLLSENEVKEIIKSSAHKSCCLDPIETPIFVKYLDKLAPIVTIIINESLEKGIVPDSFKNAIVTPLLKKPNLSPEDLKNFRPVSNLPFLSKVLERTVALQLKEHLSKHHLFEPCQSAYRQNHSTETALLKIHSDLLGAADEGKVSVLALLDLSCAFDTIDHSILIERLFKTFGLSNTVLEWFKSYLTGRTQTITVNKIQSHPFSLECGVPQGSVLGPLLYTLYTQPLSAIITRHLIKYHMYADDTQLYASVLPKDMESLFKSIEECINDVKNWMNINKLKLNESKTEILFCNPKKLRCSDKIRPLKIEGQNIMFTDQARNLGVYFDSRLSMEYHVNYLCKCMYLELRRIGHLSKYLSLASKKTLVSSFVFSRMDYCNSLLFNLPKALLSKLQRIQNYAARLLLNHKKHDHITHLLLSLHWLPVELRIKYKIATLCFKCRNGTAPEYLNVLLTDYTPSRPLRSNSQHLISVPPKKGLTKLSQRSFHHAGPSVWNSLPLALRSAGDISESSFKKNLKTFFMHSLYDDLP